MPWEKEVYSTNVASVAYDEQTQEMILTFQKGARYAYSGVPEDVAAALVTTAPSVTQMLNTEIKGVYPYRKL